PHGEHRVVTVVGLADAVSVRTGGSHGRDDLVAVPDDLVWLGTQAAFGLLREGGCQLAAAVADLRARVGGAGVEVGPLQVRVDQIQHRRRVAAGVGRVGPADEGDV